MVVSTKVFLPTNYCVSKKIQKVLILLRYKYIEIFLLRGPQRNSPPGPRKVKLRHCMLL